jgi:hypothetical protein
MRMVIQERRAASQRAATDGCSCGAASGAASLGLWMRTFVEIKNGFARNRGMLCDHEVASKHPALDVASVLLTTSRRGAVRDER